MANIKISQLTAAASTVGTQEFEVNESGTSKKVTGTQIKTFVKDGLAPSDLTGVTATAAELNYTSGVTSAIQTQLDAKAPLTGTGTSGTWPISITGDAASVDGKSIETLTAAGGIAYATSTTALAAIGAGTAGQVLTSNGASAPTWSTIATGGMTLLGTLTTTSGTTQTLSGLTLTSYKLLYVAFNGPSPTTNAQLMLSGAFQLSATTTQIAAGVYGYAIFDLVTGRYTATTAATTTAVATATSYYGNPSITTASTSISFIFSSGSFDAGSILIYGVK